jgi:beta-glucosidase
MGALVVAVQPVVLAQDGSVNHDPLEARVDALLDSLTLEQKVAQMIQGEIRHMTPEDVRRYGIGSVLNGGGAFPNNDQHASVKDWLDLADAYHQASVDTSLGGAGIPIIWGTDAVHGHNNVIGATLFPHNIGLGAARDPQLAANIAAATAREVKATGIDWIFAPTVAVAKDYRWGRTYESYGADPALVAAYAGPVVQAMQEVGVLATAKHFIGDGGTWGGEDQGDTRVDLPTLLTEHGTGYWAAIDADVGTVMASFNSWNGVKVHGDKRLLTDVLKQDMGFDGFVVSDWNGHGQIPGCSNQQCAQAINAGVDMIMVPKAWLPLLRNTIKQVQSGEIPESRIDDAVRRILRVKLRMGLMTRGLPSERASGLSGAIGSDSHRALARDAVRRSMVLLKNEARVLPLDPGGRYLVAGVAADDIGRQSGGWTITWQGTGTDREDFPGATSILDGIRAAVSVAGGEVITEQVWQEQGFGQKQPRLDAVIMVFGEAPYAEGQGDIDSLAWQQRDRRDLKVLAKYRELGVPVVSVFVTGRPRWVNAEINASDAFVVAWLPGSEGAGIADLLIQDREQPRYDFAGRLPFAWPDHDVNPADVNAPVEAAAFPVGYGLSLEEDAAITALSETAMGKPKATEWVLFAGSVHEPWRMLAVGPDGKPAPVGPAGAHAIDHNLSVSAFDYRLQEDARRIVWPGTGHHALQIGSETPADLSKWLVRGGVLEIELRLMKRPTESVQVAMFDAGANQGADASGVLDATDAFMALEERWQRLAIPLACFDEWGTDIERVTTPLHIATAGDMVLDIARAAVREKASPAATVWCPQ